MLRTINTLFTWQWMWCTKNVCRGHLSVNRFIYLVTHLEPTFNLRWKDFQSGKNSCRRMGFQVNQPDSVQVYNKCRLQTCRLALGLAKLELWLAKQALQLAKIALRLDCLGKLSVMVMLTRCIICQSARLHMSHTNSVPPVSRFIEYFSNTNISIRWPNWHKPLKPFFSHFTVSRLSISQKRIQDGHKKSWLCILIFSTRISVINDAARRYLFELAGVSY